MVLVHGTQDHAHCRQLQLHLMFDACVLYCTARAARGRLHVYEIGVSGLLLDAEYCTTENCVCLNGASVTRELFRHSHQLLTSRW